MSVTGTAGSGAATSTGGEQLTVDQVTALCYAMANQRDRVSTAAAVILAESSGKTAARCYNRRKSNGVVYCGTPGPNPDGSGGGVLSIDRGLCQFNSASHAELSDAECDDPKHAVAAMFHVSHGFVDFHEWATYTSGAYRRYLPITQSSYDAITAKGPGAVTQILAGIGGAFVAGGNAVGHVAGGVLSVGEFLAQLANPKTWKRVVLVLAGLAAVLIGAFMLNRDLLSQIAGSAVTNAAGAAAAAAV